MPQFIDRTKSLEQLEGERWGDPPADSTSLVRTIYEWRRRPIGTLEPHELARLIGQNVGLRWLLPLGVEILREEAIGQAAGGFLDGDLLYAVVTRSPDVWTADPELGRQLKTTVSMLTELSRYLKQEVETFLASLPEDI
ncbi:contact-dependent growth inhibition system immunity protein [Streptomyces blattellae]|uniref:contact-dependent growth inhibition system immunity protein n=1 Tax=Streptomyces blattellae TaxID=2569855 RepID=UPI001E4F615B|nr:contact-dependent growth inhibition system immunity protein [Streptomyces blattellae]